MWWNFFFDDWILLKAFAQFQFLLWVNLLILHLRSCRRPNLWNLCSATKLEMTLINLFVAWEQRRPSRFQQCPWVGLLGVCLLFDGYNVNCRLWWHSLFHKHWKSLSNSVSRCWSGKSGYIYIGLAQAARYNHDILSGIN